MVSDGFDTSPYLGRIHLQWLLHNKDIGKSFKCLRQAAMTTKPLQKSAVCCRIEMNPPCFT